MNISKKKKRSSHLKQIEVGNVLISKPFGHDQMYSRSVILIIDHTEERTIGIMINKQSTLAVNEALPELECFAPLYYGGLSNKKAISYIHRDSFIPRRTSLNNGLFWGGDYDYIRENLNDRESLNRFFFYAGFVQWHSRQLETEIYADRWWLYNFSAAQLFDNLPAELWENVLLLNNQLYAIFDVHPDPSAN